jgi:hypothetical protein
MKRLILLLIGIVPLFAAGQSLALKTNLVHDATATMNLGVEARLGGRTTLDVPVSYNPWRFDSYRQYKLLLVQPEFRYWLCETFNGHFFGLHLQGGQFNTNNVKLPFGVFPSLERGNFQGDFYGAGVSWGYQWIVTDRWAVEANIGAGYIRSNYVNYECVKCGQKIGEGTKNYWGPTRAGLSLIYMIF